MKPEISFDFITSEDISGNLLVIALNKTEGYQLAIAPQQPTVLEISNKTTRGRYPSIFHYIVMVEGEDCF